MFFIQIIYHLIWLLFILVYGPFHLIRLLYQKKYRGNTIARLGLQTYPSFTEETYWIHSVSVGETQVAALFAKEVKKNNPNIKIIVSTITQTGNNVAKNSDFIDACFYYPLDIHFLIKKIFKDNNISKVFVVETDLWLQHILMSFRYKIPFFVINGKLSDNSCKNYKKFYFFSKYIFNNITKVYVQNNSYRKLFNEVGVKYEDIKIINNLKLDVTPIVSSEEEKKEFMSLHGLDKNDNIIVFGSTHKGEEELIIEAVSSLDECNVQAVIVPRHPERFNEVERLLKINNLSYAKSSLKESKKTDFLLVDEMGVLMKYYEISTLSIVCGSFVDNVGGHNIFEPAFYNKPIIYGNYMHKQKEFDTLAKKYNAALSISKNDLAKSIKKVLSELDYMENLSKNATLLINRCKGSLDLLYEDIAKTSYKV